MGIVRMESPDDIQEWKTNIHDALHAADYDCLNTLLHVAANQGHFLETALRQEPWIFTSICHLGLVKIAEWLLTMFKLDVNMTHDRMTGLQLACQAGHPDVVEILLSFGAQLQEIVSEEDSEFCLATLYGHEKVIDVLTQFNPDVVSDVAVRYCLFYFACKGGNLNLVHKHTTPEMDVNKQISYVTRLKDCGNLYPLFSACQGDHYEVAKFLIGEWNARITKDVCLLFPEIVCRLIRNMFMLSSHSKEHDFQMADIGLEYINLSWFEDFDGMPDNNESRPNSYSDMFETKIDLSKNRLSSLPSKLLWQLQSLVSLNLAWNPLKGMPCPSNEARIDLNSLTCLLLSHCQLQQLNICIFQLPNLEELDASHNQMEVLHDEIETANPWKCQQLKNLNLSHNYLSTLPSGIKYCINLELLYLNNNRITRLCSPWHCPLLTLDISYNKLTAFPPSCDQFWTESLQVLNASHNHLDQLYECMVKMNVLKNLDVSYNEITSMPRTPIWSCPLICFNLSHNKLKYGQRRDKKVHQLLSTRRDSTHIELPISCLAASLNELYLNHNDLHALPAGVCHLQVLSILDISHNPNLQSLPLEIGMLWSLLVFKVEGIEVEDNEVQARINALNDPKSKYGKTFDFVIYMEQKRRNCMHHDHIKMVVFGCKNSGNQCIVQRLMSHGKYSERQEYRNEHRTMCVSNWMLPYSRRYQNLAQFKRNLSFTIWEFPINKAMAVIHPCFLTQNSLYLIVHDVLYEEDDLTKVSQHIATIQASVLQPCIVVVCVYQSLTDKIMNELHQSLILKVEKTLKCHYAKVKLDDKSSMDELYETIYSKAIQLHDVMYGRMTPLINRKVPELFIDIFNRMKALDQRTVSRGELLSSLSLEPKDLQDTGDRRLKLQEYLLQVGSMLHYNVQIGDLWNLVVLDPVWLYDLFNSFFEFLKRPQIDIEQVKKFVAVKIGLGLFPAFISLLELFNIGVRLNDINGKESLLIPSFLSKQPPAFQSDDRADGLLTSRLYFLPVIPRALWSHIISQLIPAFNRLSNPSLTLPGSDKQTESSDDTKKSFKRSTRKSKMLQNLCVKNKGIQFWRSGIMVWHDQGLIMVEEIVHQTTDNVNSKSGILVTVRAQSDPNQSEGTKANYKALAVIGVITDELEEILELFNPKFMEYMQECHPIALCPHCHKDVRPGQGIIKQEINHFQINKYAPEILWKSIVFCNSNAVDLRQLMPEFMFLELPEEFCVRYEDIEIKDEKLGHGNAGTVSKGHFKQKNVAIKSFYNPICQLTEEGDESVRYANVGDIESQMTSMARRDKCDTENQLVLNAFMELRREVSILSKLKHKCIIAFLGVCVKRQLLIILELAPLGSFRSVLTEARQRSNVSSFKPSASEPAVIMQSIFEKDLTFKILLQVSSGLSYLHSHSIIFRDLKPDNILVMSLELSAEINVKVSDYGISRFSTMKGVSGIAGTVCYMAPEVLAKQTYTNKVDVYSLGIVMFETVTGVAPAELLGSNERPMVSEVAKSCAQPHHVKLYKVKCNFPYLENLMEECWEFLMDDRPTVKEILKKMSSEQFLLLHDALRWDPYPLTLQVTCIYACQSGGRMCLWISESSLEGTSRFFSVYDIKSSMFTVQRKEAPGSKVIAMAKVRNKIWLISKECKNVEELVRGKQNKFELHPGMPLDETASCIVCHKEDRSEDNHPLVLIGHENGTITAIYAHTSEQQTVSTTKLNLDTSFPVSNIVTVDNNTLIAAAEHSIFLLTVQEETGQQRSLHASISVAWFFSFYTRLNIIEHLNSLVRDKNCVWCSFQDKNLLLKYNWEKQSVEESLILFSDSEKNLVNITTEKLKKKWSGQSKVKNASIKADEDQVFKDDLKTPSQNEYNSENSNENQLYVNTLQTRAALASSSYPTFDEAPPLPTKRNNSTQICIERRNTTSCLNEDNLHASQISEKSSTLPLTKRRENELQTSDMKVSIRPPHPMRRSTVSEDISITSLCMVSDLLAVGTDCGGIFLLPVACHIQDVCPLHLPLLQHPKKTRDDEIDLSNSLNSSSVTSLRSQLTKNAFSISQIILAGNKVVSLLKDNFDGRISRRNHLAFREKQVRSRRSGGVFESAKDMVKWENSLGDLNPATTGLESRTQTFSDMAIWNEVSSERLDVIKTYTKGFV